uniref:ABC-2 type transporter transmembrane domain-containing protein n=1 Tax=Timema cristinae TaxID=61476 RepID=A0A7R9D9C2_TIMCR|nr:unnamed protein product [Timema cristinae]
MLIYINKKAAIATRLYATEIRFAQGIAVMAGLCFTGSIKNTQLGVQSVQGALFILVSENTFSPMYSVLATFPREIPLFMREYRSGLYSTHIYYISKMIAMFPGLIVEPLVFVILTYWLAGLRDTLTAFLFTAFITIMTMNVSTACGCFFSSAFESVALAMACLVPFDYVLMITSGMFVKIRRSSLVIRGNMEHEDLLMAVWRRMNNGSLSHNSVGLPFTSRNKQHEPLLTTVWGGV